jgi:hypothetical protein
LYRLKADINIPCDFSRTHNNIFTYFDYFRRTAISAYDGSPPRKIRYHHHVHLIIILIDIIVLIGFSEYLMYSHAGLYTLFSLFIVSTLYSSTGYGCFTISGRNISCISLRPLCIYQHAGRWLMYNDINIALIGGFISIAQNAAKPAQLVRSRRHTYG